MLDTCGGETLGCRMRGLSLLLLLTIAAIGGGTSTHSLGQSNVFRVQLQKQQVPVVINGREVAKKTAYFGVIFVGLPSPQNFTVVFDTGSGHVVLPSSHCKDLACRVHKQYDRSFSRSFEDPDENDQVSLEYGTGHIEGDVTRDLVCLGAPQVTNSRGRTEHSTTAHCTPVQIVTAQNMSDEPFSHFGFDGVLGLGLPGLSLNSEFHVLNMLSGGGNIEPLFSFYLSYSDDLSSEITFGGHDVHRLLDPLHFVPVVSPDKGHWKVAIVEIRIGNETVDYCSDGSCSAIVDTGTSLLGVPQDFIRDLLIDTAREAFDGRANDIDCRNVLGPDISFLLEGGYQIIVESSMYSRPAPTEVPAADNDSVEAFVCRGNFLPLNMPELGPKVFLWGEPVLRKYYTTYDLERTRVGFARAAHGSFNSEEIFLL